MDESVLAAEIDDARARLAADRANERHLRDLRRVYPGGPRACPALGEARPGRGRSIRPPRALVIERGEWE